MVACTVSPLELKHLRNFRYGGAEYDFAYLVYRDTGEHLHEVCGFALTSAITGKHTTINSSITMIEQLKLFFEELILWNDLDWRNTPEEVILSYLYEHSFKTKGRGSRTISLQRHAIQSFYNWAYQYGFIDVPIELNIGFDLIGFRDHLENPDPHTAIESQFISQQEFETLLANVPGKTRYLLLRNELILLLGYHCGIRTHELTHAHNFRVEELRGKIECAFRKGRTSFELPIYGKGAGKLRSILITPKVFDALRRFLFEKGLRAQFPSTMPLFLNEHGKAITSSSLGSSIFRKTKARCLKFFGKKWRHRCFHSLRHSYATNLATWCAENGYDWRAHVPMRMGHTHYSTSQIYVEVEALMNNRVKILNELKPMGWSRKSPYA